MSVAVSETRSGRRYGPNMGFCALWRPDLHHFGGFPLPLRWTSRAVGPVQQPPRGYTELQAHEGSGPIMNEMLINRTSSDIVLRTGAGDVRIPPSRDVLKLDTEAVNVGRLDTFDPGWVVPVVWICPKPGLLDEIATRICDDTPEHHLSIVSGDLLDALSKESPVQLTAMHCCVAPDTSPDSAVRDSEGRIIAVRRLRARGDAMQRRLQVQDVARRAEERGPLRTLPAGV